MTQFKRKLTNGFAGINSTKKNHIFEIYKLHFENILKDIDRRQNNNHFYVTINLAIFAFWGMANKGKFDKISFSVSIVGFFYRFFGFDPFILSTIC